jgi:cellulose synthase/poly-beta-1,6-N-acetylglucosamine synthase-like glycosyltransferase
VLDDSTDDTTARCRARVEALRAEGFDIELLHRTDRTGFKAGALEAGLEHARGDYVAIFDADFVPSPDFLRRAVPHLLLEGMGMVQARWGHLNADDSWLTRAQATLLDGHFVIEHTARHAAGHWFNFNGTAGVWRRQAIADGGGWQHDTLTEDLDLSYRVQMAGWDFRYLVQLVAPAELPPDMAAFKTQQHRWAKGSIQTARKLLGRVWRSDVPLGVKLEASAHLLANVSYPLVVLLTLLLPWAVAARIEGGARELLVVDLVLFSAALFPFLAFYGAAVMGSGASSPGRLMRLPAVLALGLGMAVAQTRAVMEGLFGSVGTFVRTPKRGGATAGLYRAASRGLVGVELAMAAYLCVACVYVVLQGYVASLPFLMLFACGYGAVGLASMRT